VAESLGAVVRVLLWFGAITATLVLAGFAYTRLRTAHFRLDVAAIPNWFLHLTTEQWMALGVGVVVAAVLVVLPCSRITGYGRLGAQSRTARIATRLITLSVFLLYAAGVRAAYLISRALGSPRDWAVIHSVYSWVYVGYSFCGFASRHWKQPPGVTIKQFLSMIK
jgi:hypothetical protein